MTRLNLLLLLALTAGAQALRRARAGAGTFAPARSRIRSAAAGSKHVGGARTRRAHRRPPAAHACPRRETPSHRAARGRGEMKFAASPVLALTLPTWRSRFLLSVFIAGFALLLGRAAYLQGLNNDFLQAKGESRYSRVIEIPANRGRILDRNGEALAISTPVKSIWAIPGEVHPSERQLARLGALLEMSPREIEKRLADTGRDFVFLKRQISPEAAERIAGLHIPGRFQNREYRRYSPSGEAPAHVLGFTGADDIGQEGVELAFQDGLAGKPGSRRVIKDRLGQTVEDVESIKAAQDGHDLALAVDVRIQNLAFSQLRAAVA